MSEFKTFAGLTVDGDITSSHRGHVKPRPKEELEPLFRAVLEDEAIVSFGWHQYTPYFNDGDVCEFNVYDMWVLTKWDAIDHPDDFDAEHYNVSDAHPTLAERPYTYERVELVGEDRYGRANYDYRRVERDNPHFDADRLKRCEALNSAIQSAEFELAMLGLFGDHAEVKVTRDGITVESYEHD